MKIRKIAASDWDSITAIQTEAYTTIAPESEEVMRRKAFLSPATCFVAVDEDDRVLGFCFSHPWAPTGAPALHATLDTLPQSKNLYLHDLAVSAAARGKGVAGALCRHILSLAAKLEYGSITLVSVQNSTEFWKTFGFVEDPSIAPPKSYGDGASFMRLKLAALSFS